MKTKKKQGEIKVVNALATIHKVLHGKKQSIYLPNPQINLIFVEQNEFNIMAVFLPFLREAFFYAYSLHNKDGCLFPQYFRLAVILNCFATRENGSRFLYLPKTQNSSII